MTGQCSVPNNAPIQKLVIQEQKQKNYKTCSRCKKNTWHVEYNHLLQPPKYLITANRFNYINNEVTKNMCLIFMDLDFMLGPYKFNLQANVDHPGYSMYCDHYTTFSIVVENHWIAMIIKL